MNDLKLQFLNELTDQECAIFLYNFVFKIPIKDTTRLRGLTLQKSREIRKEILNHIEINKLQKCLTELYETE